MSAKSQFALLRERRFLPFFLTQALGAFNDNVFKNALVILIMWSTVGLTEQDKHDLLARSWQGSVSLPRVDRGPHFGRCRPLGP